MLISSSERREFAKAKALEVQKYLYSERPKKDQGSSQKVRCLATGQVFDSVSAAGRSVGRAPTNILHALERNKKCGGSLWERVNA